MEKIFSLRNISKKFPHKGIVLNNVSLDIFEGECLVLAGANGSGKTVLMRMACGLMDIDAGEILFQGTPIGKVEPGSVGMVFQEADSQILGETVFEDTAFGPKNLRLSKKEVQRRTNAALSVMDLAEKREYSPRRLSGGEKRRLAVAGVLAMGCKTLVMDEPFANLDWQGVRQTLEIVAHMKAQGKTLIILTHELEKVLAFADRLVILGQGCVRDIGKPTDVLDRLNPKWGVRDPRVSYATVADCTWL
ncbi:MAG: energy-coupling factor ABC transporter ATP-binding protein [Treponema sp.]|jgi:biotin transport system ATP-binding protein|nr:energy-coupling factor ABC transporter ATP-binding protein [Treponema sp.]